MSESESIISRKTYYEEIAKEQFSKFPNTFKEFVNDSEAVSVGDALLAEGLSTGYNYMLKGLYPMPEESGIILYSVYSTRYEHFGEVLAKMEDLKIIEEGSFKFYIKGSKIIGDYLDPELVVSELDMGDGSKTKTLESVEGTLAFYPKERSQAIEIAAFLMRIAPEIIGGYLDADVRASFDLAELIGSIGFEVATANVITLENGDIIALKQKSNINLDSFRSSQTLVAPELYKFLISGYVRP